MRSERAGRIALTALAGALLAAGACSDPESYIVVSLMSATSTPITNVVNVEVTVELAGKPTKALTYAAHGATIDQTIPYKTLSVGFSGGDTGNVKFTVKVFNSLCQIGHGDGSQEIKKGNTNYVTVSITADTVCNVDAGMPDAAEAGTPLPGCDPVNPQSTDGGVTTCMSTQTCQVDCTPPDAGAPRNECITGGTGGPGTVCTSNADCMPGTQCFNYQTLGCGLKVCLRFCNGDADCSAFGATGAGPGSLCQGPVMCPTFRTAYHTCTFNCDPRQAAAATRGGCPAGPNGALACVMTAGMDQVDCACPEATRTKHEGDACSQASDCAPGFISNRMNGTQTCRPICRCNASGSACTNTTNDCPTAGTTCHPVTNSTIYGICLP